MHLAELMFSLGKPKVPHSNHSARNRHLMVDLSLCSHPKELGIEHKLTPQKNPPLPKLTAPVVPKTEGDFNFSRSAPL